MDMILLQTYSCQKCHPSFLMTKQAIQQSGTFGSVVSRHRSWQQDHLCLCGPAVRALQTDSLDDAVISGQPQYDDVVGW